MHLKLTSCVHRPILFFFFFLLCLFHSILLYPGEMRPFHFQPQFCRFDSNRLTTFFLKHSSKHQNYVS